MSTAITTRQTAGTGATIAGVPLTNAQVDTNFINLNIAVLPAGGTAGQVLSKIDATDFNGQWIDNYATQVKLMVKNSTGATINKGSVVYISGAVGANALISLAQANSDATSATTIGILETTLVNNASGLVVTIGTISGLNTSTATEGDPVWLSGTTAGAVVYGIANKPQAPTHIVYLGTVTRSSATVGEIQVMVNNGWELDELHDVQITSKANNDILQYNSASAVWKNVTPATARTNLGLAIGTDVQAFSSSLTAISASQTANFFLAAPNGAAGVPTFRALVAADVPTLNQSTTGNAATATNVAGGAASQILYQTGAGATSFIAAPTVSSSVLSWNGTAFAWATVGGATISDDTTTAATYYPTFATATSGSFSTAKVSSTKLTFNPSTGTLTATTVTGSSDETLKTNWRGVKADFVDRLADAKSGIFDRILERTTEAGVSAQAWLNVLPETVVKGTDGKLSVAYGNAALVSAIELAKRLVALEATVAKLVD